MTNSQTSEGRAPGERRPAAWLKNTGVQRLLFSGSVFRGSLATAQPAPWTRLITDINKDEQQLVIFLPLRKIKANYPVPPLCTDGVIGSQLHSMPEPSFTMLQPLLLLHQTSKQIYLFDVYLDFQFGPCPTSYHLKSKLNPC